MHRDIHCRKYLLYDYIHYHKIIIYNENDQIMTVKLN